VSRAVDLVLPDSGPLISLARANRLDLLELSAVPIVVLDVVRAECLRKPEAPDHATLARWFERAGNRITVVPTPLGPVYEQALASERSGAHRSATRGLGDAALTWALVNIDRLARPSAVPLVIVEDRHLAVRLNEMHLGHIISTRVWLAGLEEAGLADYHAVIAAMAHHGRALSTLAIDAPVDEGSGPSSWIGRFGR
jgi:hypothetical protein